MTLATQSQPRGLTENQPFLERIYIRPNRRSSGLKNMCKAIFFSIGLLLLCSFCQCKEEEVHDGAREMTGTNGYGANPSLPLESPQDQTMVSSAVQNAKNVLGIDSSEDKGSPPRSSKSLQNTQALYDNMKKEFNTKILHATERLDANEVEGLSKRHVPPDTQNVNVENPLKPPQEVSRLVENSQQKESRESFVISILNKESGTNVPPKSRKTGKIESIDEKSSSSVRHTVSGDIEHKQPVVKKEEPKEKNEMLKEKSKDLPERSEEYVKMYNNNVSDIEGENPDKEDKSALKGKGKDNKIEEEEEESISVHHKGTAEAEEVFKDVPPVGSKLHVEEEVVNAMKIRSHILANSTINPAEVLDGGHPHNYFIDNGEKTSNKFPNARHFFTNISSKNFTSVNKGGARRVTGSGFTRNNTSPNVRHIIIFTKNKATQTDGEVEVKSHKVFPPDENRIKISGDDTQTTDRMPQEEEEEEEQDKKEKLREDSRKRLEVTIEKEESGKQDEKTSAKDDEKGKEEEREGIEERVESSEKVNIFPTTVISDISKEKKSKEKKDKKPKPEESLKEVDEITTTVEESKSVEREEENEIIKDEKDVVTSEKTTEEDLRQLEEVKAEEEVVDSSANVEEKTDALSEESKDEKTGKVKEKEEKVEGKEKVEKEELEEGKEKERTIEGDKVEKKERSPTTDSEDLSKEKKAEPKKKEKKKSEESDKQKSEEVGEEGMKSDEEKSEDNTLETYSQFTQRVSAEKKNDATNGHGGTNGHSKGSKVKGKNYASPDCGAKVTAANPEASHSSKVIHPTKDEYMLNKCRDKIWFVIELCESIRPQKFDIANFELFSNLPKDIQVFGSHRYPSRDWTSFGWFKGQEANRALQSFLIDQEDFFKYIKVEITSYYGSEFYCPISAFQIYGLSEFEVIDTIEDAAEEEDTEDDDDNEPFIDTVEETAGKKIKEEGKQQGGVIPTVLKNMFSGVMDVIKRGYRPSTSSSEPGENCYSLHPKFAVDKDICPMAGSLNYILSCYNMEYEALMLQPFVSSTVKNSSFCRQLALTMCAEPEVNDSIVYDTTCNNSYVCVMLSPKHVLAMCFMQDPQIMDKGISCDSSGTHLENYSTTSDLLDSTEVPTYVKNAVINTSSITSSDASDTNLSRTLNFEATKSISEALPTEQNVEKKKVSADIPHPESKESEYVKPSVKELKVNGNGSKDKPSKEGEQEATQRTAEAEENLEVEGSGGLAGIDITEDELPPTPPEETIIPTTPSPIAQPAEPKVSNSPTNKESVVVRLSNKIKALEYNMSISSQYLEELSRRYKRQMEEMQRQFNLTIAALNDTSYQAYERDQHHQRDIEYLEEQLANVSNILQKLVDERETLAHTVVEQHVLLMVVEVIVLCMVFTVCSRRRNNYVHNAGNAQTTRRNQRASEEDPSAAVSAMDQETNCHNSGDNQGRLRLRRRSVDSITAQRNSRLRQRRPSEEALNISGTYQDLLIIEPAIPILMDSVSDRKKKRKSTSGTTLKRSKSNASIADKSSSSRRAKRIEKLNMSSAGVLFCGDVVDSKTTTVPPPHDLSPMSVPDSLDFYALMHEPLCNDESSGVFYDDHVENSCSLHLGSTITELGLEEKVAKSNADCVSKRHSIACCLNCDNVGQKKESKPSKPLSLCSAAEKTNCDNVGQKKESKQQSKSLSLCSATEKTKVTQEKEKAKKVKKQKRAKVKDVVNLYSDSSQTPNPFPDYNKEYYYPKPNGISYSSPIERYDNYYYNGHTSVHFSMDADQHCDHTYSVTTDPVNGGYLNGISTNVGDHYRLNNEFSHTNHDTMSVSEKKKMSPRVKSKVKLRSDNWEWYSSQHIGSSTGSSETVSTSSDSSGKNRMIKKEEEMNNEKIEEKKGKKKKKSKSKSPVLLEEETVLEEVEAGT